MYLVLGLLMPFLGTTLGSALVFFMKDKLNKNVEKFLQNNSNFKIIPIDKNKISIFFLKNKQFLNILPDEEKDGFFICKLQKM